MSTAVERQAVASLMAMVVPTVPVGRSQRVSKDSAERRDNRSKRCAIMLGSDRMLPDNAWRPGRRKVMRQPGVETRTRAGILDPAEPISGLAQVPEPRMAGQMEDVAIEGRFGTTAKAARFADAGPVTMRAQSALPRDWVLTSLIIGRWTSERRRLLADS
jgi:hypothetical protein